MSDYDMSPETPPKKVPVKDNSQKCTAFLVDEEFNVVDTEDSDFLQSYIEAEEKSVRESLHKNAYQKDLDFRHEVRKEREERQKGFEGSNQSQEEIGYNSETIRFTIEGEIAPRPYNPRSFSSFLEISPVHKQAVQAKVRDSVGRDYKIRPKYPILKDNKEKSEFGDYVLEEDFRKEAKIVEKFLEKCNSEKTFQELFSLVAQDREAIGWGAFEVIREASGKIARLERIPAVRLQVLEGWEGFVEEELDSKPFNDAVLHTYYQPFGKKIQIKEPDPIAQFMDPETEETKMRDYDPEIDGELNFPENKKIVWNLKDRKTGEDLSMSAENWAKSANEVLYFPNNHINTVYYGYTDAVPCLTSILANAHIDNYVQQFFQNNCVPRYVIVVKGADVNDEWKRKLAKYMKQEMKDNYGHTLILTLHSIGGVEVDVEFRRIDAEQKEADFLETKRANNQEIMTAHGIPPALLAIHESASLGSGKGNAQSELYKDRFVVPTQRFYSQKINKLFKYGLGVTNVKLDFDPLDIKDALATAQVMNILLINGVLTINEARMQLGLEPIKGADIPILKAREGTIVRVDQIPEIESKLMGENFTVKKDKDGKDFVELEELAGEDTEEK